MIENTGLEEACYEANTPDKFRKILIELIDLDFKLADLDLRKKVLLDKFNNLENAKKLGDLLF
jgi:hypothetical protein